MVKVGNFGPSGEHDAAGTLRATCEELVEGGAHEREWCFQDRGGGGWFCSLAPGFGVGNG